MQRLPSKHIQVESREGNLVGCLWVRVAKAAEQIDTGGMPQGNSGQAASRGAGPAVLCTYLGCCRVQPAWQSQPAAHKQPGGNVKRNGMSSDTRAGCPRAVGHPGRRRPGPSDTQAGGALGPRTPSRTPPGPSDTHPAHHEAPLDMREAELAYSFPAHWVPPQAVASPRSLEQQRGSGAQASQATTLIVNSAASGQEPVPWCTLPARLGKELLVGPKPFQLCEKVGKNS